MYYPPGFAEDEMVLFQDPTLNLHKEGILLNRVFETISSNS